MDNKKRGKNLNYLRSSNLGTIIKTLLVSKSASRQILAEKLNLTKMSITYLIDILLEKHIVEEKLIDDEKVVHAGPGRRTRQIVLCPDSIYAIGVNVSRRMVTCSVSNIMGEVKKKTTFEPDPKTTKQSLTEIICDNVALLLKEFSEKRILGIGIANVGLTDMQSGVVMSTTEFYSIADWDIGHIMEERFSLPVFIVEDMNSASLAELYYGAARGLQDFVYLGVTYGIGAGIIIDEELFEGNRGFASEIGHCSINHRGKKCACGNTGCMELYLSVPAVLKKARQKTWAQFLAFCEADPANPIMKQFLYNLGIALVNIINSFDPQAIVIGHEGAMLPKYCFERLQLFADNYAITRNYKKVYVWPSSLEENIPCLGPSSIVFTHLFQGAIDL